MVLKVTSVGKPDPELAARAFVPLIVSYLERQRRLGAPPAKPLMLTESQVIDAVCRFLKGKGFKIEQRRRETETGDDIVAVSTDGKTALIEAKGETSSKAFSSRFGKMFSGGQVLDHVSKALYRAVFYIAQGVLAGMAFPKNNAHVACVSRISSVLADLSIEVFWVLPDGGVEVAGHWKTFA